MWRLPKLSSKPCGVRMTEKTLTCPVCGYSTKFWDEKTHWCIDCFGGIAPSMSTVTNALRMRKNPPSKPFMEVVRDLQMDLKRNGQTPVKITCGEWVFATLKNEASAAVNLGVSTKGDELPMSFGIDGLDVFTADDMDPNAIELFGSNSTGVRTSRELRFPPGVVQS